jgi:acetyl-CoA acetyltransferase
VSDVVLAGAAESRYTRHPAPGTTTMTVLAEAGRRALEDAGLKPGDVDGLAVSSFSLPSDHAIDVAWRLGLRVRWLMDAWTGGASGVDMLQHARRAVEAGDATNALLLAGDVLDRAAFVRLVDEYNSATRDHLAGIPTGGPNALFALLTQRHMERHDLRREDYGRLVVAQREWATLNPGAVYREPLTLDTYLDAPFVAEPLTRYDCVPVVAGADAIVVSAERPGDRRAPSVRAVQAMHNADQQEGDGLATGLREIRSALWSEAGCEPSDVDIAWVYDDYPAMVLVQLEDLGFLRGSAGAFVESQLASRRFPVNTSGGQLSAGQAGAAAGLHGLVEVVTQLRGEAGGRQVDRARIAVVTGYGMVAYRYGACANATVLGARA